MSDLPTLTDLGSAESIPAALAAPKPKKGKGYKNDEGFVAAPATFSDAAVAVQPTSALPADTVDEEPTMATTIENMTDTSTQQGANTAQAMFGDMNGRAKDAMEKSTKLFAEMNGFTKGNVEALVESGKLAFAGMQSMAQEQAAYVRKQFEGATEAARTMATVKSPTEFVKLQGDYIRQQFDAMVAQTSHSTEAVLKLAGEVAQPISNRVAVAVEKIKQAA
ncbi:phasin family protein [Sphingomonas sp.]|jgi:phasin family protein|uniref:phasin family protein n=1 Tax=Sphingomonas sp. TaxID=28214 RepID=UPI002D806E18|nr:phasin family protein [Sphingomonas sp.]HEU0045613.1 phasin family protein [Sphingomonas sp.]